MATEQVLAGKKVLWVEDDPFLSDILALKLTAAGAALTHVSDGPKALEALKAQAPDVLLLDVLLPGMSGFELLEQVRALPQGKDLPAIFLSNMGQQEDRERAQKLGARKFLVKAVATLDEIVAEVAKAA